MLKEMVLKIAANETFANFIKNSNLTRPLRERFIGGETLDEAIATGKRINKEGMHVSFAHLGEDVRDFDSAAKARDEILELIDAINQGKINGGISVKPTHLGLDIDKDSFEGCYYTIVDKAANLGIFVRCDMELSKYTDSTLDVVYKLSKTHQNQGVALQAYLKRSEEDVKKLVELGIRTRLCKGAYLELPKIAFANKEDVDENYKKLMETLLLQGHYPAIATHDPRIIDYQNFLCDKFGIKQHSFENEMLYGVGYDLQKKLVLEGKSLGIYLPFGASWYPYLTRRLAERPANMLFFLKNLLSHQKPPR